MISSNLTRSCYLKHVYYWCFCFLTCIPSTCSPHTVLLKLLSANCACLHSYTKVHSQNIFLREHYMHLVWKMRVRENKERTVGACVGHAALWWGKLCWWALQVPECRHFLPDTTRGDMLPCTKRSPAHVWQMVRTVLRDRSMLF